MFTKKRVYLDYAAATPLSPTVCTEMQKVMRSSFGNPSAIHQEGRNARQIVEEARAKIGKALQVRPEFVTFTSGGTESNNLAIRGLIASLVASGRLYTDMEIITTTIEHPSVSEVVLELQSVGVSVQYVAVDETGKIIIEDLRSKLSDKTVLVSVSYINSEIGTIQPVHAIKKTITEVAEEKDIAMYLHLDAAQAPLWTSCRFDTLGADLVSLDVGKCNGPKGVGILVRSRRVPLKAIIYGGGQENELRPGTENTSSIAGAALALFEAQALVKERAEKVTRVRDSGIKVLKAVLPQVVLNGAVGEKRVANNINISIPGLDTEYATVVLDTNGFAVSTKSACAGAGSGESAVVKTISGDSVRASSTLRISLGPDTTLQNLKDLANVLKKHVDMMSRLTRN